MLSPNINWKKKCKLAKKAKHLSSAVFEMESSQGMFQKSVCFLGGRSNLSKEKILFLFFFFLLCKNNYHHMAEDFSDYRLGNQTFNIRPPYRFFQVSGVKGEEWYMFGLI